MNRDYVLENQSSRDALRDLIADLGERDLERVVGEWKVADWLCHLAFWDGVISSRLKSLSDGKTATASLDSSLIDWVNDGCHVLSRGIPGRVAAQLALESAQEVDAQVEQLSDQVVSQIEAAGMGRLLRRSLHRMHHVEKIRLALASSAVGQS